MNRILVSGAIVLTMNDRADIFDSADILVEGDRIKAINPSGRLDALGAEVIDGRGRVAMPGLVNAHTHAAMTLLRGYADDMPLDVWLETRIWPRESMLRDGDVYDGTMLAAAEMIKGGTTCFTDMYFGINEIADAVMESGLRSRICAPVIGLQSTVDEDIATGISFIESWAGRDERVTAMFGPHSLYTCEQGALSKIAKEAGRLGVGVHIHFLETRDERAKIKAFSNRTPIDGLKESGLLDLPLLAVHANWLTGQEVKSVSGKSLVVGHCPGSSLKLASGIAPVPALLKHGVSVAIGTDGAASNNNLDMFEEMRLAALIHKADTQDATAVSAYQALTMATRNGAQAIGMQDQIGQLTPGYKADIILIDVTTPHMTPEHNIPANIVYSGGAADVTETVVDGRILMRDREIVSLNETAVMKKAVATAADLLKRT